METIHNCVFGEPRFASEQWERALQEESQASSLEAKTASFEERKFEADIALRKAELEIKAREADWRAKLLSPVMAPLMAGVLTIAGTLAATFFQSRQTLQLEESKFSATRELERDKFNFNKNLETQKQQHELIVKMISVGNEDQARANIKFLAESGLIADEKLAKRLLAIKTPGVLPATSGAITISRRTGCEITLTNMADAGRAITEWAAENVEFVTVPQLAKIPGGPSDGKIRFHHRGAEQLQAAWAELELKGLLDRVVQWGGSYNARIAWGSSGMLSSHGCGLAFDINYAENPYGRPPKPIGERGSVLELVRFLKKHGFRWGGNFKPRPDAMHFEYVIPAEDGGPAVVEQQ